MRDNLISMQGGQFSSANKDQESFGNIQLAGNVKREPRAYCTSGTCAGRGAREFGKKLKRVPIGESNCPDCGFYLVWK